MSPVTAKNNDAELRDLYRELILDHARSPRNFGKLDAPTHTAAGINPLCGDKVRVTIRVGRLAEVSRPLVVVEDHGLVELAQVAHANTSRTRRRPATRASTSALVL